MHGVSLNVKFVLSALTNHVAQCLRQHQMIVTTVFLFISLFFGRLCRLLTFKTTATKHVIMISEKCNFKVKRGKITRWTQLKRKPKSVIFAFALKFSVCLIYKRRQDYITFPKSYFVSFLLSGQLDYKQSLLFLGPSSKTRETHKWPRAWLYEEEGRLVAQGLNGVVSFTVIG